MRVRPQHKIEGVAVFRNLISPYAISPLTNASVARAKWRRENLLPLDAVVFEVDMRSNYIDQRGLRADDGKYGSHLK
jgi:hypothetical protein